MLQRKVGSGSSASGEADVVRGSSVGKRTLVEGVGAEPQGTPDIASQGPRGLPRLQLKDIPSPADAAPASSGAPLPAAQQATFERSLGADLSSVRVHTGAASE